MAGRLLRATLLLLPLSAHPPVLCMYVCIYIRMYVCIYVCMYVHTYYVLINPPMPIHYVLAAVFASCFYVLKSKTSRMRTYFLLRPSRCVRFVFLRPKIFTSGMRTYLFITSAPLCLLRVFTSYLNFGS